MKGFARRQRWLLALLAVYAALWLALSLVSPTTGLLTPDGSLHVPTALLTVLALLMRLVTLFVIVPLLVYRVLSPDRS